MFSGGWNASASANSKCKCSANAVAIVDLPDPDTPMTMMMRGDTTCSHILTARSRDGAARECMGPARSGRGSLVEEPVELADRTHLNGRELRISCERAGQNLAFAGAGYQEGDIAAAVERRKGQSNPRFGARVRNCYNPTLALGQCGLTREQRRGMTIISQPQQSHLKQRQPRVE